MWASAEKRWEHTCTVDTSQLQPIASIVTAWECLTVAMKIALELSDATA